MRGAGEEQLRRLGCPFCDYSTQVADRLGGHLEREHPDEVVLESAERPPAGPGDADRRVPAAWECLECGFVLVPEDVDAGGGRPVGCPECDAREADRPTGVDLFVPLERR